MKARARGGEHDAKPDGEHDAKHAEAHDAITDRDVAQATEIAGSKVQNASVIG